jgi:hypothetical protein
MKAFFQKRSGKYFSLVFESAHCGTRDGRVSESGPAAGGGGSRLSYIFTLSQLFFDRKKERKKI